MRTWAGTVITALAADKSPPIVVAILGATALEFEIERMLRPKFRRHSDDVWEELTSDRGPLSTFANKITVGYAMGLYDDVFADALNKVRKIRNGFAHSKRIISFDNELIAAELKSVPLPAAKRSLLHKQFSLVRRMPSGAQGAFVHLCLALSTVMLKKQNRTIDARLRRSQKRTDQASISPLARVLMTQDLGFPKGIGALSLGHQRGDPTTPARGLGLFAGILSGQAPPHSGGK